MTLVNTTAKINIYINGTDYSDYLIEGNLSDDSAYSTNIITTKGSIVLGGDPSILDFNKTKFPLGSRITIYAKLSNGSFAKVPRGQVYVLNSSMDMQQRLTILEVGCSLAYLNSRPEHFQDEIKELIEDFIPSSTLDSFVIDNFNLSTLQTLLEIEGKVIFQDAWGNIQSLNEFGNDGLGANLKASKLKCFDVHSAISVESIGGSVEDLPSAIIVESNVNIPSTPSSDTDPNAPPLDDYLAAGKPPPFISSETTKTIKVPDFVKTSSFFAIFQGAESGEAGDEAVPGCGSITGSDEEGAPETVYFTYTASGGARSTSKDFTETSTSGRYVSYNGPGNQVNFEYDFEYNSAMVYANSMFNAVVNKYVEIINNEVERAKSFLSKANNALKLGHDYATRPRTTVYTIDGEEIIETEETDEGESVLNAINYYNCVGTQYYNAAENILEAAENFVNEGIDFIDQYTYIKGYSSWNTTTNEYGPSGELIKKTTLRYIHPSTSEDATKAINDLQPSYRLSPVLDALRYQIINSLDFSSVSETTGQSFDQLVSGDSLLTSHSENTARNVEQFYNLELASTTTTTYEYSDVYTTETEVFVDQQNLGNNYTRINYSSTGSRNAPEEDRIKVQRDGNGNIILNTTTSGGKPQFKDLDLACKKEIKITNSQFSGQLVPVSWLGKGESTDKTIQLPFDLAPLRTKLVDGVVTVPDITEELAKYEKILCQYATNQIKKITSDNFGFRITEKGTRAEIFGYYPYYPITLSLKSLQKRFKLRAAATNWVFDSENLLCSIDCFNVGSIETAPGVTEASPFNYTTFKKVEYTAPVTTDDLKSPQTAASIRITGLPTGGQLLLNGVAVVVGDVITIADINSNNLTFVPTDTTVTTTVAISYEALASSGQTIGSGDGIFPELQTLIPDYVFADAGEFTDNTSNGGFDSGAGDFDAGTRPGGAISLEGGDFDTGAAVVIGEPAPPSGASAGNGDTDPENDLGTVVVDEDDNQLLSDELPGPEGDISSNFEVAVNFNLHPVSYLSLSAKKVALLGWDYGRIKNTAGTDIDMGSVVDANIYALDFGTIVSPTEPILTSSVV